MLRNRILTVLVLLPLVIGSILFFSNNILAIASLIFFVPCILEWSKLMKLKKAVVSSFFALLIALVGFSCWFFDVGVVVLSKIAFGWWFIALCTICFYPKGKKLWELIPISFLVGCLIIIPAWFALVFLHNSKIFGPVWLLFLCCIVWATDTGAYIFGKKWGKHRLAPSLSPGKTWEGVIGAFLGAIIVVIIFKLFLANAITMGITFFDKSFISQDFVSYSWFKLISATLITTVFAIVGDLTESMFKRIKGVKDSGKLLPGHGGVLDRLDSILSAAPIFVFCLV